MNSRMKGFKAYLAAATVLAGGAVLVATPAVAQVTTGSLRGRVTTAEAAPAAGASVVARNTGTNQTLRATTAADGSYALNGLRPGNYEIVATSGSDTATQRIQIAIGQAGRLDFTLGAAEAPTDAASVPEGEGETVVITGSRLTETRTSEVATNVSQDQIRILPQTDRNFLSFAALAPGVKYNDSENGKGFQSGAAAASQVNVFVDGISLKNKLREGGVAGQQNSRGNPFGQLAVQEFRVLTQNYKAEYEQAGAAIITSVTKSGTNEFHGEVFGQYTDKSLTQKSYLDKRNNRPEPAFERKQYGVSLGGPIVKDKLFFFAAYEGNDQDRAFNVDSNADPIPVQEFEQFSGRRLSDFEGAFVSPFRGDFYFGKLTLTPDSRNVVDLSFSRREETDIQNFGGNVSYENAENKVNKIDTYLFKWTHSAENFTNEFSANYLEYIFNPVSLNPDLPTFEYAGVMIFGGKDSTRREVQRSHTLRDDFTYTGFADHAIKFGARVEVTDIEFANNAYVQPRYTFRRGDDAGTPLDPTDDLTFAIPAEARLGLGNGLVQGSNTQIGLYVQDDWDVTSRLQLNLGVRWDYETNAKNNDYVTPDNAARLLRSLPTTSYFNPEDYISTGSNRKPFTGAIAPRVGFSWDLNGDRSTVIFGGAGRYYDRNNFNYTIDELSRTINPVGVFRFSTDGRPRRGATTIAWNPSYLTREGLLGLIATQPETGLPELLVTKNDAKPPVNDQFSLGVRQRVGPFQASLSGSYQRGRNGYAYIHAARGPDGQGNPQFDIGRPFGYTNVLIGYDGLDTRYKALYFTLDKAYSERSGWGLNIAYTLSKAERNGGAGDFYNSSLFNSLDLPTPDDYGWNTSVGDERHRVVISGIVDLPLGLQFSTLTTLSSGQAYSIVDETIGTEVGQRRYLIGYPEKNCIKGVFAFCEVNVTLAKRLPLFGGDQAEIAIDVLNAFNNKNFSGFDGAFNDRINPNTGEPFDLFRPATAQWANTELTLPRRIQFRLGYRF